MLGVGSRNKWHSFLSSSHPQSSGTPRNILVTYHAQIRNNKPGSQKAIRVVFSQIRNLDFKSHEGKFGERTKDPVEEFGRN